MKIYASTAEIADDIDCLIYSSIFSSDEEVKKICCLKINQLAKEKGIYSASIHNLYMAIGNGKVSGFTVPAINIRTLTYDTARIIFKIALEKHVGVFIFELARSEIDYTAQRPEEYTCVILAAALKEGYSGPVFIQGDHFQFSQSKYAADSQTEIDKIKKLIKESVDGQFYNIDIDASTLVDLNKQNLLDQQKANYEMTALMSEYIRSLEPKGVTISIGGEIGHIGGKNSTVEEFEAFMTGYKQRLENKNIVGISKVSVQTGTSHGGVPMPDGTIAKIKLDFNVLESIGSVAREKYHIGGSVQHGASTLPNDLFDTFPKINTLEIHLATGFQNIVYEHLPRTLRNEMYEWLKVNCAKERKEDQTEEQFFYTTRKKALGPFKQRLWELSEIEKEPIRTQLYSQLVFLMEKLHVINTVEVIKNIFNLHE